MPAEAISDRTGVLGVLGADLRIQGGLRTRSASRASLGLSLSWAAEAVHRWSARRKNFSAADRASDAGCSPAYGDDRKQQQT